jgi:hypothetical protein
MDIIDYGAPVEGKTLTFTRFLRTILESPFGIPPAQKKVSTLHGDDSVGIVVAQDE